MTDESIIAKIEALLAKAERTEYEAEAEAFYAKAGLEEVKETSTRLCARCRCQGTVLHIAVERTAALRSK